MLPSAAGVAFVAAGGIMKGKGPETLLMAGMKQMANTGGFDIQKFGNKMGVGGGGAMGGGAQAAGQAADTGAQGAAAGMKAGGEAASALGDAAAAGGDALAGAAAGTVVLAPIAPAISAAGHTAQVGGKAAKIGMTVGSKMVKMGGKLAKMGGKMVGKGMKMGGKMGSAMVKVGRGIGKVGKAMKKAGPGVAKAGRSISGAAGKLSASGGKLASAAKYAKKAGGPMSDVASKQAELAMTAAKGGEEDLGLGEKFKGALGKADAKKRAGTGIGGTAGSGGTSTAGKMFRAGMSFNKTMFAAAAIGALAMPLGAGVGSIAVGAYLGTKLARSGVGRSMLSGVGGSIAKKAGKMPKLAGVGKAGGEFAKGFTSKGVAESMKGFTQAQGKIGTGMWLAGKGAGVGLSLGLKAAKFGFIGAPLLAMEAAATGGVSPAVRLGGKAIKGAVGAVKGGYSLGQYAKYRKTGLTPADAKAVKSKEKAGKLRDKASVARGRGKEAKARRYESRAKELEKTAGAGGFVKGSVGEQLYEGREAGLSERGEAAGEDTRVKLKDEERGGGEGGGPESQESEQIKEARYQSLKSEIMYTGGRRRKEGVGDAFEEMMEDKPNQQ